MILAPLTRADAKAIGATTYCTMKPCKHGHIATRNTKTKICSECNRIHASKTYHSLSVEKRAAIHKALYEKNKEAYHKRSLRWARNNIERRREIVRRSDAKRKAKALAWRIANAEILRIKKAAYREANRDRINSHIRGYKKINKDKINADCAYRRAVKRGAEGRYTKKDVSVLWEKQKGLCVLCLVDLSVTGKHVDHVAALSRGGSNWPSNLQLLCPTCNLRKYTKSGVVA